MKLVATPFIASAARESKIVAAVKPATGGLAPAAGRGPSSAPAAVEAVKTREAEATPAPTHTIGRGVGDFQGMSSVKSTLHPRGMERADTSTVPPQPAVVAAAAAAAAQTVPVPSAPVLPSSASPGPLAVADLLAVLRAFAAEGQTAPLSGEVGSRLKAAHPTRFK